MNELIVKVTPYTGLSIMWSKVLKSSRITVGKEDIKKEPSDRFKRSVMRSQHSTIRKLKFEVEMLNVPSHVTQQFSRHHIALESNPLYVFSEEIKSTDVEHFVKTSREDRTGIKRSDRKQDDPVNYEFEINAQGLIDASKKRLCKAADKRAVEAWNGVKAGVATIEPLLAAKMLPSCVHYGFCAEDPNLVKCGFCKTEQFDKLRADFIKDLD